MRLAIDKVHAGIERGQTPFGACVVAADGRVVACEHNLVWKTMDITAHGEMVTIRAACQALGVVDLSGCTIYSTTEPCPMCFSAIHWAKIGRIVYGASIADAQAAGFNELTIANVRMKEEGGSPVKIDGGCLKEECLLLFTHWRKAGQAKIY